MRTKALFAMALLSFTLQAQQWQWAKDLGNYNNTNPRNPVITSNEYGDLFSVTDIGEEESGYVTTSNIARFSPGGSQKYLQTIKGNHEIYGVFADNNNNFLVSGMFQYSLTVADKLYTHEGDPVSFVACFDENGKTKWVRIVDNRDRYKFGITNGDAYYLSGLSGKLEKLDANGQLLWKTSLNIQTDEGIYYTNGCYTDEDDNIFVWGGFRGDLLKINGKTYYSVKYGPWSSSFIIKLNSSGVLQNVELMRSAWLQVVKPGEDGNVYLKGTWDDDFNLHVREDSLMPSLSNCHYGTFFGKLKPDNTCEWLKEIQADCNAYSDYQYYTMDISRQGNILIHGSVTGSIKYGQNTIALAAGLVAMKFDPYGDFVWSNQAYSWNGTTEAIQVAAGGNNAIYVAGAYKSDVTYGNINLSTTLERSQVLALIADGSITGVNEIDKTNLTVVLAPNPSDRTFKSLGGNVNEITGVYDQLGREVEFSVNPETNSAQLLNCEAGVYFVRLTSAKSSSTHKLIVR